MQKIILIAAMALLSGCAAKIIDSNERMVMVQASTIDPSGALRMADAECKKFGRHARLHTRPTEDALWVFNCVQ